MNRLLSMLVLLILVGCDTPHPSFFGAQKSVVTVEGSRFSIYRKGDWVEVYRTSFEHIPPVERTKARAKVAIRQATGCGIHDSTLDGDQALMRVRLDCGDGYVPPPPSPEPPHWSCELVDTWSARAIGSEFGYFECDAD